MEILSSQDRIATPNGRPWHKQPKWRRDFPIDMPEDHYVARRDFTKFLVLVSGAFALGQFWIGLQNLGRRRRGEAPIRRIAAVDQLPIGGSLVFNYPGEHDPNLLIRTGENTFLAYGQKCTHLSCAVVPEVDRGRLHCPCHQGYFDLQTGQPLAGPPRRPLPRVKLAVRSGALYATGLEVHPA